MIVFLASRETLQSFAFLVEVTFGIERVHISAGDLRIAVHLLHIRDDNRALWDVVAFVVIVSNASMEFVER